MRLVVRGIALGMALARNPASKSNVHSSMDNEKIDVGHDLRDKRQGAHDPVTANENPIPAGLRRERKGPLDKDTGRRNQ
jgi:hypothetical protein